MTNQLDMFDSPLTGNVKSQRNLMVFPFFDLSKSGRRRNPIAYDDGENTIEVGAVEGVGIATIYDKDLILYIASLMVEQINQGKNPDRTFSFTAHDFMRVAGRDTSKKSYENIKKMLRRLQGTQIMTNIEAGGVGQDDIFSWLDSAHILYHRNASGARVMRGITVTICDWLYRAIKLDGRNITVHDDYFTLSPIERRLYDIARAHCGNQPIFKIGIEKLRLKVGCEDRLAKFKYQLTAIERDRTLPEYDIRLVNDPSSAFHQTMKKAGYTRPRRGSVKQIVVVFTPRNRTISQPFDAILTEDQ